MCLENTWTSTTVGQQRHYYDTRSNIHFGYIAAKVGSPLNHALNTAGQAQGLDSGTAPSDDDPVDAQAIKEGYALGRKQSSATIADLISIFQPNQDWGGRVMKRTLFFTALAMILACPYLVISVSAKSQFSGEYKYIFPNYSDKNDTGSPKSICTKNIFDLDYFGFVWGGLNNYLKIARPETIPIHAAVLSGDDMFIFSFRKMSFVPLSKETLIYGEVSSCGLKLRPWDTPVSPER